MTKYEWIVIESAIKKVKLIIDAFDDSDDELSNQALKLYKILNDRGQEHVKKQKI